MSIIGYYVTCDDAECVWCHRPEDWPGFEDWEAPIPIYPNTEADSPTHCQHCGDIIPHNLTPDGLTYVRMCLTTPEGPDYIVSPKRREVLRQWREAYGEQGETS